LAAILSATVAAATVTAIPANNWQPRRLNL
jgi:hypothetical protein